MTATTDALSLGYLLCASWFISVQPGWNKQHKQKPTMTPLSRCRSVWECLVKAKSTNPRTSSRSHNKDFNLYACSSEIKVDCSLSTQVHHCDYCSGCGFCCKVQQSRMRDISFPRSTHLYAIVPLRWWFLFVCMSQFIPERQGRWFWLLPIATGASFCEKVQPKWSRLMGWREKFQMYCRR